MYFSLKLDLNHWAFLQNFQPIQSLLASNDLKLKIRLMAIYKIGQLGIYFDLYQQQLLVQHETNHTIQTQSCKSYGFTDTYRTHTEGKDNQSTQQMLYSSTNLFFSLPSDRDEQANWRQVTRKDIALEATVFRMGLQEYDTISYRSAYPQILLLFQLSILLLCGCFVRLCVTWIWVIYEEGQNLLGICRLCLYVRIRASLLFYRQFDIRLGTLTENTLLILFLLRSYSQHYEFLHFLVPLNQIFQTCPSIH